MGINNRIYYAVQQVQIIQDGMTNPSYWDTVHGLQSVGMTTNFNLASVFQIGQLSLYQQIEEMPDIQVTLHKVLDGYLPLYCLATQKAVNPTLPARAVTKCGVALSTYDETQSSAQGTPNSAVITSGMFVSSVRYNFPKEGHFNEEITLVGNNKIWKGDTRIANTGDMIWSSGISGVVGKFNNADSPIGLGGIQQRWDIKMTPFPYSGLSGVGLSGTLSGAITAAVAMYGPLGTITQALSTLSGQLVKTYGGSSNGVGYDTNGSLGDWDCTILPQDVAGVSSDGTNNVLFDAVGGHAHISNLSVSVNLNRDNLTELGRKNPYFRTPTFPTEVTTEIEITATSGDLVSATEFGILSSNLWGTANGCGQDSGNLAAGRTIRIATCEGLRIYCGTKNKLASVNYTGGDSTGGHVNVSYTFHTFNDFIVMHSGEYISPANAITSLWATGNQSSGITGVWPYRMAYLVN